MFRPPYLARVAAGAAVYALEETRRLPSVALHLPITAASQLLQTSMHLQQFVTSLALKGDEVFDRLANRPVEQPEWATFDEDLDDEQTFGSADFSDRLSRFDLFRDAEAAADGPATTDDAPAAVATITSATNGYATSHSIDTEAAYTESEPSTPPPAEPAPQPEQRSIVEPEVASRYDYANMTLAQLRARLRMLSVADLTALLEYEKQTFDRAPFVTMLTNRIATVQAK